MLDRESSFADAEVIATLKKRFVPLALDVWYEERREDAAGELYRKIVLQRDGATLDKTTQGFYAFAPDGALLQGWNHRGVDRMKQQLDRALDAWKERRGKKEKAGEPKGDAEAKGDEAQGAVDRRFERALPEGSRVVAVRARITDAKWPEIERGDPLHEQWQEIVRTATSLDHLWVDRDELAALAAGTFPRTLAWRIARFHCIDNTRGEPPSWEPEHVKKCEATLSRNGKEPKEGKPDSFSVDGAFTLATSDGALAYDARMGGIVETKDGTIERLDLAIRGDFTGHGEFTQGAPPGTFTLAIVLSLADEGDHAEVPPQGARWLDDYLGKVKGREGK